MSDNNSQEDKNSFLRVFNKMAPGVLAAICIALLGWGGISINQSNINAATTSIKLDNIQNSLIERTSDRYTATQAAADKAFVLAEINNLIFRVQATTDRVDRLDNRVLDLEKKIK